MSGLIPAWAGKTAQAPNGEERPRAHPRVGGENTSGGLHPCWDPGSSPRGRGKRPRFRYCRAPGRLIPAWAGKTTVGIGRKLSQWAHPRVGGENDFDIELLASVLGSSPRGRGKPKRPPRRPGSYRLIPAWAGKTSGP